MREIRNSIRLTVAVSAVFMCSSLAHGQFTPVNPQGVGGLGGYDASRLQGQAEQNGQAAGTQQVIDAGDYVAPESTAPESASPRGGESGAGSIQSFKGERAVGLKGSTEGFEPILNFEVTYPDLPEGGETLSYPNIGKVMPLTDFLQLLSDVSGWNLVITKGIEAMMVQFSVTNVTPKQAMEILQFHGVFYTFDEAQNTLYVMTTEEYLEREYGKLKSEKFQVRHADVVDLEEVLGALLSSTGKLVSDPRTGQILVWDTEANLDEMREAMAKVDVPMEARVFPLKYALAEDLLQSLESVVSDRGSVQADSRTNTVVVTDLPARQAEIGRLIEALDRKLDTQTWTLSYVEPETVQERLENLIPEDAAIVSIDEDFHQISVTAVPERLQEVQELIAVWDVKPKQVQIEAYLVTANSSITRNFGIDWAYFDQISGTPIAVLSGDATATPFDLPGEGQRFSVGTLPYQVPLRNPLTNEPIRGADGEVVLDPRFRGNRIAAVIDYLNQEGELTILSKPRVTVRDGEEASFENTEEIPYQNYAYSAYGSNTNNNNDGAFSPYFIPTTVQKETVGTILKVLPRVTEEGTVTLEIEAEDSTAEIITIVSGGRPSTVPQVRKSLAKTQVVVHDGQTIALGGLRSGTVQDDIERVPVLGNLPLIGRLFKTTERMREERDLLVFLTPTIVSGYTQQEAQRLASIDAAVAEKLRNSLKPLMERIETRLSGGRNEMNVAVGQYGEVFVEHQIVTLEQLDARFQAVEKPEEVTVVVRAHPGAPAGLSDRVAQLASNAGLQAISDPKAMPFVPSPAPGTQPGELLPLTVPRPGSPAPLPPPGQGKVPPPPVAAPAPGAPMPESAVEISPLP